MKKKSYFILVLAFVFISIGIMNVNAQTGSGIVIGEDVTGTPVITYDYDDLKTAVEAASKEGTVINNIFIFETDGAYYLISKGTLNTNYSTRVNKLTPEQNGNTTTLKLFAGSQSNLCDGCLDCDYGCDGDDFVECVNNCSDPMDDCNHIILIGCEVYNELSKF